MIWNNVELFNVSEICPVDDGIRIYRFPKRVRDAFENSNHPYSIEVGQMTTGCEIRFVGEGANITLTALDNSGTVDIFRGDFLSKTVHLPAGTPTKIELRGDVMVDKVDLSCYKGVVDTAVFRVVFNHDYRAMINSVEPVGEVRPPRACEIPEKRILAYGSSITHGAGAGPFTNSYIYNVGRLTGAEVLCKGMGGSCFIQPEVADYIATEGFDIAIFELGINMVSEFPVEVFRERAEYLIKSTLALGKPVVLISNYVSYYNIESSPYYEKNKAYVKCLEELYEKYSCDTLYYIRGDEMLDSFGYLTADVLHPSPFGHAEMSRKIANKLKGEFKLL